MPVISRSRSTAAVALACVAIAPWGPAAARGAVEPRVIRITAKKFEYNPSRIVLKKGVPVVLELVALDRTHGFKVPALGLRADVLPEQVARVELVPDKVGSFVFSCDVFCGDGHEDMDGTIVVEE